MSWGPWCALSEGTGCTAAFRVVTVVTSRGPTFLYFTAWRFPLVNAHVCLPFEIISCMRIGSMTSLASHFSPCAPYSTWRYVDSQVITVTGPEPRPRGPVPRSMCLLSTWVECSFLYISVSHRTGPWAPCSPAGFCWDRMENLLGLFLIMSSSGLCTILYNLLLPWNREERESWMTVWGQTLEHLCSLVLSFFLNVFPKL